MPLGLHPMGQQMTGMFSGALSFNRNISSGKTFLGDRTYKTSSVADLSDCATGDELDSLVAMCLLVVQTVNVPNIVSSYSKMSLPRYGLTMSGMQQGPRPSTCHTVQSRR